ncbi:BolA protein [Mariprofundus ferrinatatus]|uniref:BolA protein n=1 Tax=Mariprofundus ferrinatatus TaxID=1921087 RepID=A0A2K8L5R5_9PROT|nr:BolA family protein [Mariprofundus ferrinatatus]ATX81191.1 BolA protein [Mariprofundus ferrinatatus]
MNPAVEIIRTTLEQRFAPVTLHIVDESWKHATHAGAREHGGGHFLVEIRASVFNGLSRMQRHRMVMDALKPLFPDTIHAASIKAEGTEPG